MNKMTVEQARAVLAEHEAKKRGEQRAANEKKYVGKFFKYHNSYGADRPRWWLYAAATGVDDWGHVTGWEFQHDSDDRIRIEPGVSSLMLSDSGWIEITADEFWIAAGKVLIAAMSRLTRIPDEGGK